MTIKSAEQWPAYTLKLDTFGLSKVRGRISPTCAQNERNTDMNFEKTQQLVLGPIPAVPGGVGPQLPGAKPIAYQAWQIVGSPGNKSTGDGFFVRRSGLFSQTAGGEFFTRYSDILKGGQRYATRTKGKYYPPPPRTQDEINQFKGEVNTFLTNKNLSIQNFPDINEEFYKTGTIADVERIISAGGDPITAFPEFYFSAVNTNSPVSPPSGPTPPSGPRPPRGPSTNLTPPPAPTLPNPVVKIVTRMPLGYAGRGEPASSRPQMIQRYKNDEGQATDDIFVFRYIPQGIKYSGLAGEWVEVPRAEDIPFVDWARWQLMKVSFSFIIADDRTEPNGAVVPDGLEQSIDAKIEQLRRMSQRKVPVMLANFDDMLSFQLRRGNSSVRNPNAVSPNMEFVINDLSITATRRTADQITGAPTMPSHVAVAQVEITLTEIPVEVIGLVALPTIDSPYIPPSRPPTGTPLELSYVPLTDTNSGGYAQPSAAVNPIRQDGP
jgi:hypothetical protein